ncbi:MAG: hypothetical protein ACXWLS_05540 [Myxococcaceae bacterium]
MVQLGCALEVARHAHPDLRLDPEAFFRFVARRVPALEPDGVPIHAADLYLACAALE